MLSDCEGFPRASIDYAERTKHLALEDELGSRAIAGEGALSDEATVRESRVLRSTWNLDAVVRHDRVVAERYFSLHFTNVQAVVALEPLALFVDKRNGGNVDVESELSHPRHAAQIHVTRGVEHRQIVRCFDSLIVVNALGGRHDFSAATSTPNSETFFGSENK